MMKMAATSLRIHRLAVLAVLLIIIIVLISANTDDVGARSDNRAAPLNLEAARNAQEQAPGSSLAAPALTAQAAAGQITLTWGAVANAVSYELWVWDWAANDWRRIGGDLTGASYTHSGLAAGAEYYYAIRAVDASGGTSEWSQQVSATVPAALAAPALTAQAAAGQIILTWGAVANAVSYELWVWDWAANEWRRIGGDLTGASYTHSGLAAGAEYYYVIRAVDASGGTSEWSQQVSATVPAALAAPALTAQAGAGQIILTWGAVANAVSYELWVWDWAANEWRRIGGDLTGASYTHSGLTAGAEYYYVIRAVDANGGTSEWSQQVSATVMAARATTAPPASSGGDSFAYGVQAHMVHNNQAGLVMQKTRELGFGWVKQQIEWKVFEHSPGAYDWNSMQGVINAANNAGVSLLFSVVNAPAWARETGFDPAVSGPPADPNTFARFLGAMAAKYCNTSLKAIEVWNEPNLHYEWGNLPLEPARYVELIKPAYAAIKAACPSIYVISGALAPAANNGTRQSRGGAASMDDFEYLEKLFQAGLNNHIDGVGAHPSGYNVPPSYTWQQGCEAVRKHGNRHFNGPCDNPHHSWSFRSTMESYRNIVLKYGAGDKRIWPTEFGWAAGGAYHPAYGYANDNDFQEQAAWTVEAYRMMKNWGWVGPAILWNLNFRVVADGTEKAQWGIVRNDWSPLPAFNALKAMQK